MIENLRHTADTSDLAFRWSVEDDGVRDRATACSLVRADPRGRARRPWPCPAGARGRTLAGRRRGRADRRGGARRGRPPGRLRVTLDRVGTARDPARHPARARRPATRRPTKQRRPARTWAPPTFDAATGRLVRLGDLELDGPWLDLHRAPTENDHGQGSLNDIASVWAATGMDRMLHRTDASALDGDGLVVRGRTVAHDASARRRVADAVAADG